MSNDAKVVFMQVSGPKIGTWSSPEWITTQESPVKGVTYGLKCVSVDTKIDDDGERFTTAIFALTPLVEVSP